MKHVATIYFETDGKTELKHLVEVAAERMEQAFSVHVTDTYVEDVDDDNEPRNGVTVKPLTTHAHDCQCSDCTGYVTGQPIKPWTHEDMVNEIKHLNPEL